MPPTFGSFREFYPYYLGEHAHPVNRRLHFVGTSLVLLLLLASPIVDARLLWALPIAGYGFAWVGHFVVEKNRPATFRHPLWSLMGDFKMYADILAGRVRLR
ncbi:MAG: hypothetical protein RLZZ383_1640 [Pseudomonadota bacterium]|jgi:hypothetical protein